jgi:hypothetical protein
MSICETSSGAIARLDPVIGGVMTSSSSIAYRANIASSVVVAERASGESSISLVVNNDAERINELYRLARGSLVDSVRYCIECGRALLKKKEEVGHGRWMSWVEANLDFDHRTATRLMTAAQKAKLGVNVQAQRRLWRATGRC